MWMLDFFMRIENDMLHPHPYTFQYNTIFQKSPSLSYQKLPQLLRKKIYKYILYKILLYDFEKFRVVTIHLTKLSLTSNYPRK